MSSVEKMNSDLQAALGSLAPAVVSDSLRYVSARPPAKATAQDHVRLLIKEGKEIGVEQFVARLKKSTQAALLSDLVDVEDDDHDSHDGENDVADRLERELKSELTGADPTVAFKQVNSKIVKACATELMLDPKQELEALRGLLVDEMVLTGMETLFTILPRSLLEQYCAQWKLERTGSKAVLVARLLAHLFDLDLDDQLTADEPDRDEMEVEAESAKPKKKTTVIAPAKKAPVVAAAKTKPRATKKAKKEESDDDDDDMMDSGGSDNEDEDDEQEEWERSKKKPKKATQPLKEEKRARAEPEPEPKSAKRPEEKKRPRVDPVESKTPASGLSKRLDLATTSRVMSPRTPGVSAQKQATKQKKTLLVPSDMQDLNVDMKESMITRKYKIDQIRQCLKMNGLSEVGLKAKLAARLHAYLVEVANDENDENADPNMMA